MTMVKRVCVVGAGVSGLAATKSCLDEGLEPTCFDIGDDIGGLWKYHDKAVEGRGSVFLSLVTNISKEMICYSDFPMPSHYPTYLGHTDMLKYLHLYAENFKLNNHIRLKTKVEAVTKRPDFPTSGQWDVVVVDENGKKEEMVFDAILVCSGHNYTANFPKDFFPGIDKFKGHIIHTREYKEPSPYVGKRVLVIGFGNSGADIATEISRHASQVFVSTRAGAWILDRVADNGYPFDMMILRRSINVLRHLLPFDLVVRYEERKLNYKFNHINYGVNPAFRLYSKQVTINDDVPHRIILGKMIMKPNVASFTDNGVVFVDGSKAENLDAVVFATGYHFRFPFLEVDGTLTVHENKNDFYKNMFLPKLPRQTLAIIGLVEPNGPVPAVVEMQSRFSTQLFKGLVSLPGESEMLKDISEKREEHAKKYQNEQRRTVEVPDFLTYVDDMARKIGVKPNLLHLCLRDPALAFSVFFGPCTSYQYRLHGPGRWEGAAQAIRTQWDRTLIPTRRSLAAQSGNSAEFLVKLLGIVLVFAACYIAICCGTR
uniref:dimethylaniline monooxygenase [N-oxide-forming] 2-like isoform X1 n=2 Tax=Myxine glutinosa TaxID=7769 RepID=UPI00358FBEC6